jgi:hypothetical protein
MLNSRRRLGNAGALLRALEPDGGFQPSQVTTGISRRLGSKNVTDEEAVPEQFIEANKTNDGLQKQAITPEMLEALAATDEISDVLQRLCSYIAIVPDIGSSFAYMNFLPKYKANIDIRERTINDMQRHWQIVQDFLFANSASLQLGIDKLISQWLTYGKIYFAIIRETKFGKIIDIHTQLTDFKSRKSRDGEYWETDFKQFIWEKEDMFVLDWHEMSMYTMSYVAGLMRTYNFWRTTERTRVANAVMTAQFRSFYTVPTQGLGKTKARQKMSSVMGLYKREIKIDDTTGETSINGQNSYPVNTELWVAETTNGSVKIENPGDGNVSLNNTDLPQYFMRKYYKQAKLPLSKYEAVDSGTARTVILSTQNSG